MKNTELNINGGSIDSYDEQAYVDFRENRLSRDKLPAYNRAMG